MNSESGRKSPQELKNQARQALREAERTVSQVTVMEHNGKECSVVLDGFAEHLGVLATRLPVTV